MKSEKKLIRLQRQLSRKELGSKGRAKARLRLSRQHEQVANQRKDFLHKTSRKLVDRYGHIAIEDLNVGGMLKNHHLAKHITDAGWGEFTRQLAYKGQWHGSWVEEIDRFAPSSKACHVCGYIQRDLELSEREWDCPQCRTYPTGTETLQSIF